MPTLSLRLLSVRPVGAGIGGDAGIGHTFQQLATIGSTYVLSPNMVLDANVGYTRMSQYVLGSDYGKNYGTDVFGIPGTNGSDIRQSGIPQIQSSQHLCPDRQRKYVDAAVSNR